MKKWSIRIVLTLLALLILFLISGWIFISNQAPDYNEEINIKGIAEQVDAYYDEFGIPHIYANSLNDAYKTFGFVHAKDRLWQMELLRRIAPGRISELFGESTLETDKFFRTIDLHRQSEKEAQAFLEREEGPLKDIVTSYVAGVNHFIENGTKPIEYILLSQNIEPFTVTDVYNIMGYMAFSFSVAHKTEPIADYIGQKFGLEYLNALDLHVDSNTTMIQSEVGQDYSSISIYVNDIFENLPVPELIGSNSWVIGPSKTATGGVLFANDPHIGYAQPSVWYEAHINAPDYEIYGNHIAGFPIAHIGNNRHHAIGLTMFENDDLDYYREVISPENPDEYWAIDKWEEIQTKQHLIKVKDRDDVKLEVRSTRHGPIISDVVKHMVPGDPVAMWWIYKKFPLRLLEATYQILTSTTLEGVRKGASMIHAPGLNVMYGDIEGNIAWWAAAKLPKRPGHVNSKLILDGSSGKDDINEFFNFTANPQAVNPSQGFVYSANNQSIGTEGTQFPGYYLPEDRARRIVKLLSGKNNWKTEDVKAMILDVTSENVVEISHEIALALEEEDLTDEATEGIEILLEWGGTYDLDAIAPTIYTKLIYHIMEGMMSDELSERWATFNGTFLMKRSIQPLIENGDSPWWDDVSTEKSENRTDILKQAIEITISEITEQLGTDKSRWEWSNVHTLESKHSFDAVPSLRSFFNVGPFPIEGSSEVINNTQFVTSPDGTYEVGGGPSCRRVINLNDLEGDSWSILPTGQSGNVFSPHYSDQAEMFATGKFRRQLMSKEEIVANAKNQSKVVSNLSN